MGEIKRLFRDGGSIKVSRSLKELALKAAKKREELMLKNGKDPKLSELAKELKTSTEQLTHAICSCTPLMSLTQHESNNNKKEEQQIDVQYKECDLNLSDRIAIKEAISKLEKTDRSLIYYRYFCGETQIKTAKKLKMTQVQVSRREKKILKSLKKFLT